MASTVTWSVTVLGHSTVFPPITKIQKILEKNKFFCNKLKVYALSVLTLFNLELAYFLQIGVIHSFTLQSRKKKERHSISLSFHHHKGLEYMTSFLLYITVTVLL